MKAANDDYKGESTWLESNEESMMAGVVLIVMTGSVWGIKKKSSSVSIY
jgi:hypothetical protein